MLDDELCLVLELVHLLGLLFEDVHLLDQAVVLALEGADEEFEGFRGVAGAEGDPGGCGSGASEGTSAGSVHLSYS